MADVKFTLDEWKDQILKLDFEEAAKRGFLSARHRSIVVLQRATDNAPPASPRGARGARHTGRYRRSWKVETHPRGITIFNDAPYAPIIEDGRRKGSMPPTKPLVKWAKQRIGLSHKEAQWAAFAIALAIKKRGLKPRKVLKDSLPKIKRLMLDEVEHEIGVELTTK